jgi:ATP-dependent Lhr-like helicase
MLALEANGTVLRGHFTPGPATVTEEWCERGLLARIHRLTIGRLRREIEPVSAADFIRFLLRWQHVHPGTQLHGRAGLLQIIGQLQGLELPAPAWEAHIFPARIGRYDPSTLEELCLAGEVSWGRLGLRTQADTVEGPQPRAQDGRKPAGRALAPTRAAPLAFMLREHLSWLLLPASRTFAEVIAGLSDPAREVAETLKQHGASFLTDIAQYTGRLPIQVEEGLWELVACGLVTGDGMAGLRTLLMPEVKRRPTRRLAGRWLRGRPSARLAPMGRWSLLRPVWTPESPAGAEHRDEALARQLLRRYGVVFRELLARETQTALWRTLLPIYRRLEARGEIRGGRFVAGFIGEQFALPEAVDGLRAVRRQAKERETVIVAAADPLNLVGILTPGSRLSPFTQQVIVYRSGVPAETGALGAVKSRLQMPESEIPL